jgi:hypothetical protein
MLFMDPDNLIEQAMGGAGKMIGGNELYILECHGERNEFRIKTADEVFKDNMMAFAMGFGTGYMFLGMYTTKEAAEEVIEAMRSTTRGEDGKCLW